MIRETSTPAGKRLVPVGAIKVGPRQEVDQTSITADVPSDGGSRVGDLSDIEDDVDDDGKFIDFALGV